MTSLLLSNVMFCIIVLTLKATELREALTHVHA